MSGIFANISINKEGIVTKEDFEASQKALRRMIDDFKNSYKGKGELPADHNIMEAVMHSYEDELKAPITGLVFGNLMTTMLIQV
jgi:hypothetical protein